MNKRQAKKIMRQQPDNGLSRHQTCSSWLRAWTMYNSYSLSAFGKRDHRIEKAITLTNKK